MSCLVKTTNPMHYNDWSGMAKLSMITRRNAIVQRYF